MPYSCSGIPEYNIQTRKTKRCNTCEIHREKTKTSNRNNKCTRTWQRLQSVYFWLQVSVQQQNGGRAVYILVRIHQGWTTFSLLPAKLRLFLSIRPPVSSRYFGIVSVLLSHSEHSLLSHICLAVFLLIILIVEMARASTVAARPARS